MKYNNFRNIARIMGLMAWLMGLIIPVYFLITAITAEPVEGASALAVPVLIVLGLVAGFIAFIFLYALSQFIYVSIDIERNTRAIVRAILEEIEPEESETEEGEAEERH